jgi:hypothetical protein
MPWPHTNGIPPCGHGGTDLPRDPITQERGWKAPEWAELKEHGGTFFVLKKFRKKFDGDWKRHLAGMSMELDWEEIQNIFFVLDIWKMIVTKNGLWSKEHEWKAEGAEN